MTLNESGGEWIKEGERLSGFLLQVLLFETSGPYYTSADWIDAEIYSRLRDVLGPLPLSPWHWPASNTEFLGRSDRFAIAYPTEWRDTYFVQIRAQSQEALDELRPLVPEDHWDSP